MMSSEIKKKSKILYMIRLTWHWRIYELYGGDLEAFSQRSVTPKTPNPTSTTS